MASDEVNEDNWLYGDSNEAPDGEERIDKETPEELLPEAAPGTEPDNPVCLKYILT